MNANRPARALDTTAEAERVQIEVFQRMSPAKRLQAASALYRMARSLMETGVRMRHPDYSDEQVRLAVIRLTLPEKLFLAAYPDAIDIKP